MLLKSDYMHAFSFPLAFVIFSFIASSLLICKLFLSVLRKEFEIETLGEVLVAMLISGCLLVPMFQTLRFSLFLPWEEDSSIVSSRGVVASVERCLYNARYNIGDSKEVSRSFIVVIDETEYFCLDAGSLSRGDVVDFSYYPKSRMVVSLAPQDNTLWGKETENVGFKDSPFHNLPLQEILIFMLVCVASAMTGAFLAVIINKKRKPENAIWVKGELFYRSGFEFILSVYLVSILLAVCLPTLKHVAYIKILLPTIILICISKVPVSLALGENSLTKLALGTICIREADYRDIRRITMFCTDSGSLVAIELQDADIMQCKSLISYFYYGFLNRKSIILLPIYRGNENITETKIRLLFDGQFSRKMGLTSVFPLFPKK